MWRKLWAKIKSWFTPTPVTPPVPAPVEPPAPVPSAPYIVTRGQRIEREVTVPFSLSFQVTGVERFSGRDAVPDTTNNPDTAMLAWAYFPEWASGKKPHVVHVRTYKLIVNDGNGPPREAKLLEDEWNPSHAYQVRLIVRRDLTLVRIEDLTTHRIWNASLPFAAPEKMIVGYGWPHAPRPGVTGAKITGVTWG